jgi:CheY-like chemotaxis protein
MASLFRPKPSLLIVDDDERLRASLSQLFCQLQHAVLCAEDGFSALRQIREQEPRVIVSDLQMPGMSGFEFLSVVNRRFPRIHVVAMSGAYAGPEVPDGIAADAFYAKGTSVKTLVQMVAEGARARKPAGARTQRPGKPQWVPSNGHDGQGHEYVSIACPDCLRTFPQAPPALGPVVRETNCAYCAREILYAIVRQSGPAHAACPSAWRQDARVSVAVLNRMTSLAAG